MSIDVTKICLCTCSSFGTLRSRIPQGWEIEDGFISVIDRSTGKQRNRKNTDRQYYILLINADRAPRF